MKSRIQFALFLAAAKLFTSACNRQQAKQSETDAAARKPDPIAVRMASAETRMVARSIDVTGSLMPDETVSLSSEVPGRISVIRFDFGQTVRKGDIVVELDKQEFLIQLDRTKAAIAQALARLGLSPDQENVTPKDTPAIRQVRAQLEDAKSKYDSAKKLVDSGDIARERFVELEKALQARQAAVDASLDELRTQLASLQSLKADKRLAEKRLNDTILRAPFDGQISQKLISAGQYTKENTPILTLVKSWPLRLRLDVPEPATAAVHLGDTIRFTTEAIPDKEFTATLSELNPGLESRSRSLTAEARINQADKSLRPGMFVQVKLTIIKNAPIVVVPKNAVYTVAGLTKVFAIRNGKAFELRVAPGQTIDSFIEIPGDALKAGEPVAVDNIANLFDGAEVRPRT